MKQHKLKLVTLIVCLAVGLLQAPAFGWEFNLSGASGYVYQYYTQQGKSCFFGPFDTDASASGFFFAANGWLGPQVNNLVSGADASRNNVTTLLFPQIPGKSRLVASGCLQDRKQRHRRFSRRHYLVRVRRVAPMVD